MNKQKRIYLKNIEEVKAFVTQAEKYDFTIRVKLKNGWINAKSFMGMLAMVTGHEVELQYTDSCNSFERLVEQFAV